MNDNIVIFWPVIFVYLNRILCTVNDEKFLVQRHLIMNRDLVRDNIYGKFEWIERKKELCQA